jgi:hypothetical protein
LGSTILFSFHFKLPGLQDFKYKVVPGGSAMDGATIFVAVMSAVFFGFIIFLAVKSRWSSDADTPKAETRPRAEPQKPIDRKPRNVA